MTFDELFLTGDQRWDAIVQREREADSAFFYGVKTTRIYCLPSCSSRHPKRENVQFFDSWEAAEAEGFRACKRCRPRNGSDQHPHREAILEACRLLDQEDQAVPLKTLAGAVGLSPFYLQRLFKKLVGVSPKQYWLEKRTDRVRANLRQGERITDTIYNAGYGSSSRFYSEVGEAIGMKPSEYQRGGKGTRILYSIQPTSLGWMLVAATEAGVCAIEFGDTPESVVEKFSSRFSNAERVGDDPEFTGWVEQVMAFLETPSQPLDLPLDIRGTAFQRRVWMALREIPCGTTASYSDVAGKIGSPKAVRAVAQACASNEIAVAIPCHRVIRSNGELGGYRWGLDRKRELLDRERE